MKISHDALSDSAVHAPIGESLADAALLGSFIVNLCALAAPLAITQPRAPELKRFRFFVCRRLKSGRETFFLSMGFFPTLEEAESWLNTVRARYPNAFVSQVAGKPRVSEPAAPALTETQTLRVLEVRAPSRDAEREMRADTGSYAVQSQERVLGKQPQPVFVHPAQPPAQREQIENRELAAAAAVPQRSSGGLARELHALATHDLEMEDSSRTTGVRHLRVEILRKSKRASKTSSTRKP